MDAIMKNIYSSCDPHNSDSVPAAELLAFMEPYLLINLPAFETLKTMLDPSNENVCLKSDEFYKVMMDWTQQIESTKETEGDDEFNRTPSQLGVLEETLFPCSQSTPRPSFGKKPLSCEDLLNLSNISSSSVFTQTKDTSIVSLDRTKLEDQVNQLQYELNKVIGERDMLKRQLANFEEQNEYLHDQLNRHKTKLPSEHQYNGHLQENKTCVEEIKEEINIGKKRIEELIKKVQMYEKENNYLNKHVQKLEKEITDLEDRCTHFNRTEQTFKEQIIDLRNELEIKEHEIASILKISDELQVKLSEKTNQIDQLLNENEILDYQKHDLERKFRRYSLSSHYDTCLDEMNSFFIKGRTLPIYSSPIKSKSCKNYMLNNSLLSPNLIDPKSKMFSNVLKYNNVKDSMGLQIRKAFSLNTISTRSLPNIVQDNGDDSFGFPESPSSSMIFLNGPVESLQTELFQVDYKIKNGTDCDYPKQLNILRGENESLQNTIQCIESENNRELLEIDKKVKQLESENNVLKENLVLAKECTPHKDKLKSLEEKLEYLKDENSRLNQEINIKNIEFKNVFDFKAAYKALECEYSKKISQLEELQKSSENYNTTVSKLTNENKRLEKELKDCKSQLLETKEKYNQSMNSKSNIENKIEKDKLVQKYKIKFEKMEQDLQSKIQQLNHLKDIIKKAEDIKNIMWSDNDDLVTKLNSLTEDYQQILKEKGEFENTTKKLKDHYNVTVNSKLVKVKEQLSFLKNENENIKKEQKTYTNQLNENFTQYKNYLQTLTTKLENLECENNILRNLEKPDPDKDVNSVDGDRFKQCTNNVGSSSESSFNGEKIILCSKNRNSTKQKNTLERLRNKLEKLEDDFIHEQQKNEALKEKLKSINAEYFLEQQKNQTLLEKLKNKDETLKVISSEKQMLQNQLSQEEELYKFRSNAADQKIRDLSVKLSQLEDVHKITVIKFSQNESLLQRNFQVHVHDKSTIDQLNKKHQELQVQYENNTVENQNLKLQIQSLEKQVLSTSAELRLLESVVENAKLDISKKNEELKSIYFLLAAREKIIKSLAAETTVFEEKHQRTLQELSIKEFQLQTLEGKLSAKDQHPNLCNNNLNYTSFVRNETQAFEKISTNHIIDCCENLNRNFTKFIEVWKSKIETSLDIKKLPTLKLCSSLEVENILLVLVNNLEAVTLLFQMLIASNTHSSEEYTLESQPVTVLNSKTMSQSKVLNKFTLQPAKLDLTRSVSPDSPGIEMNDTLGNTRQPELNKTNASPDSQSYRKQNISESEDNITSTHLQLLDFDLQIHSVFPHITDQFLNEMGLHENSPKKKLTKDATEKLFTSFAIKLGLDSLDIKDRILNQKQLCTQQHRKCIYLLKDISLRLREHRCIGATDSITPVFVMLEDVRFQMQEMMQAVGQLGALTCEHRMTKCWNLVTNYVAIIKQNSEYWKEQISPDRSSSDKSKRFTRKNNIHSKCNKEIQTIPSSEDTKKTGCVRTLTLVSGMSLVFLIFAVIMIHWQCKMHTDLQICPLDDFIKVLPQRGHPPY